MPCAGIQQPDGPIPDGNTFTKNQTINVMWRIRAAHQGGTCFVELLQDGRKSAEPLTLIEFTDCAVDVLHDYTGGVQLPENYICDSCILRWRWEAGDSTTFISCADIKIVDPNAPPVTNSSVSTTTSTNSTNSPTNTVTTNTNSTNSPPTNTSSNSRNGNKLGRPKFKRSYYRF
ncbi:8606_t:CDS:1 [Ambispora leptoticha]|uniref:8606_t:CDS:1 n=1 Tax=Ambispora leptoticha TaxID=144679 RepID=A0A9N9EYS8_9GLOM|nr:8606_t:CDS:1 [Ambispora leptoticha]